MLPCQNSRGCCRETGVFDWEIKLYEAAYFFRGRMARLINALELAKGDITGEDTEWFIRNSPWYDLYDADDGLWQLYVGALGGSVDAALGLRDYVVPLWDHSCNATAADIGIDWTLHSPIDGPPMTGTARTDAIALIIAVIRAYRAGPRADLPNKG